MSTATKFKKPAMMAVMAAAAITLLSGCITEDQNTVFNQVNATRKSNRLGALEIDYGAASKAQKWSKTMGDRNKLGHSGGGSKLDTSGLSRACGVAENVAVGPNLTQVHNALVASSTHRANMLGRYDRVGTGVYKKGANYWVTHIFVRTC